MSTLQDNGIRPGRFLVVLVLAMVVAIAIVVIRHYTGTP
jgi:hypothetical protein